MTRLVWLGLALLCATPLQAQQRTRSPHGDLNMECKSCHGANGWTPVRIAKTFDHSKLGFALAGAHGTATCRACHQALDFEGVKSDCVSCHADKHRGELGANCARCHTARSFLDREVMTKAHQLTRFPLEGGHLGADCSGCHQPGAQGSLQFVGTQSECVSCHKSNYATAPNHLAGNFPVACAGCHSQVAWNRVAGMGANHPSTPIALTGVHGTSQCSDCHLAGQAYSAVRQTCDGCHHTDYAGTTNPSHQAASFPITCTDCHTLTAGWLGATYPNHPTSPLALTNAHAPAKVTCTQCHTTSPYSTVKTSCIDCHQPDYDQSVAPPHKAGQFSTTCTSCHTTTVWQPSTYQHPTSPVSLAGAHSGRQCADCHTTAPYSTVKTTCDGCHHPDFVATTNPSHTAAGYSTDCASCHQVVVNWTGASVNHPTSPVALTGVHGTSQCSDCHLAGQAYSAVKQTCDGCHHTDFVGAKEPDHVAAAFSTTCTTCHALVVGWTGATYASHSTTPINPKQGAHGAVTCTECHTRSPYSSAPTTCDGCHHADYVATANPSHTAASIATTCADCHQIVAGWTGATYASHPSAPLAMTGQHAMPPRICADCHTTATYASVAQTCDGCHHSTYVGVTDPNHTAVGMAAFAAANCTNCHSPTKTAWTGPTWTHMTIVAPQSVRLPHEGASCADCHQNVTNYTIKSCAKSGCHRSATGP